MMRQSAGRAAVAAMVLASHVGCTLIGLGFGAVDDSSAAKRAVADGEPFIMATVVRGTPVELTLQDGSNAYGKFLGLAEIDEAGYPARYEEAAAGAFRFGTSVPRLGSGATLTTPSGRTVAVTYLRLRLWGVALREEGRKREAEVLPFSKVARLTDSAGVSVEGRTLQELVVARRVPVTDAVRLGDWALQPEAPRDGTSEHVVPVADISTVTTRPARNGKTTGVLVGALLDAAVLIWAINSFNDSGPSCKRDCPTSCPWVHSFDGAGYRLEAEAFGGAILEAAQRTDRARLRHLAITDGQARLRLTNDQREVEQVDAVRLLAVDVPAGVDVVTGPDGALHAFGSSRPPAAARDLAGRDAIALVRAADDLLWAGDLLVTGDRDSGAPREGLELEFRRPPDATTGVLAVTVQSTPWAAYLLRELLALQGRETASWRARMNSDEAARTTFLSALRREGLPAVRLWDGEGWRQVGVFSNIGPAIAREQAIAIDLATVRGDLVRVRVDATPGMWMVDAARMSFHARPAPPVIPLPMTHAVSNGHDVAETLAAADGRRHEMLPFAGTVELAFDDAPPPSAGHQRLYIFEATGYYTVLTPETGPGDPRLFGDLVERPGAFARYAVRRREAVLAHNVATHVSGVGDAAPGLAIPRLLRATAAPTH